MRIDEIFASKGEPVFSFEFFPPKNDAGVGALFDALNLQRARLRLVGVRVEGLTDVEHSTEQLMIGAPTHGWRDAEQAVDRAVTRFGPGAVRPAVLIDPRQPQA